MTLAEIIRLFCDLEIVGGGDDIKQDLESRRRKTACDFVEAVAPHHEKPAHRIAELCAQNAAGKLRRKPADEAAAVAEGFRTAALDIARGSHKIDALARQRT